jgi:hypothetical protein
MIARRGASGMTDERRRALLVAALGFARLDDVSHPALALLRRWLGSWSGLGVVAAGMHRRGFDLALTQYEDRGWRATFYTSGLAHSITGATGSAFAATPWQAVQGAAWETLGRGG